MQGLHQLIPLVLSCGAIFFFILARSRAVATAGGDLASLHSRPGYHGLYAFLVTLLVGIGLYLFLLLAGNAYVNVLLLGRVFDLAPDMRAIEATLAVSDAKALAFGEPASRTDAIRDDVATLFRSLDSLHFAVLAVIPVAAAGLAGVLILRRIRRDWRARNGSEAIMRSVLMVCASVAVLTTIGIVLSLIFETLSFFATIGWRVDRFLFGTEWSPLAGVHEGVLDSERVGALPLFLGTLLITVIAMTVAVPIGLFAAIYLADFASARVRTWAKPLLEILAGIPTVVYGFFAAITVAPMLRGTGEAIGLSVASESALAAGVVMGLMIIPFISSLSDDVINSVPQSLRDGSYGLGATRAETIRMVVLPAALPGIVSAVLLGVSRAVGETMIVVMAAGQGANLTVNPLEAVTTVTVQIVMLITGDTEAETAAGPAFTLGFTLFCVTLILNVIALRTVRRYREAYD
ncbi:MAG: phosphate ABC transporter permease subunit PstC [Paracoccaceae bacterium]|nr:phosphate ABC transporter permease subunit PstC [Paracoccaceae bacterium]